ncbi:MAG: efflux RND transporter periplasmic adaptor subunit [Verrucomicrobiota bacterium]
MSRPKALIIRAAIALLILIGGASYYAYLINTGPEPEQRPAIRSFPVVEVMELERSDFQVRIPSQGIVQPRTNSDLTAEVSGKVSQISDRFLNGAFFAKGDVLVELDARNYETALARAEADLTRAKTELALAKAATERAREDWKRLGLSGSPTNLNLKIPQLNEAEANVKAAVADVAEAKLNVARCKIAAPYAGRVLSKMADVGQFVNPGTMLGQIYSTELFEVRLPLRNDQLAFLNFNRADGRKPAVALSGEAGGDAQWPAWIERTEAAVDARSRQLFVIAGIDLSLANSPPLPSGTFVDAEIEGKMLTDVFVIPRSATRSGTSVMRITPSQNVDFQELDVVYGGDANVLVARMDGNLKKGDLISLTPLPFVSNGDQVTIKGAQSNSPEQRRPPLAKGPNGGGKGGKKSQKSKS